MRPSSLSSTLFSPFKPIRSCHSAHMPALSHAVPFMISASSHYMEGTELKCSHLTARSGNKEIHTEIKLTLPNLTEQIMWAVYPVMEMGSYERSSPPPFGSHGEHTSSLNSIHNGWKKNKGWQTDRRMTSTTVMPWAQCLNNMSKSIQTKQQKGWLSE